MELSMRIKDLRKELGLTQKEFASKINVHACQLLRYERGQCLPSIRVLNRIAEFCEVSLDYLVHGQDKRLLKQSKINDPYLLDLTRRIDKMKKAKRDRIKWAIEALLSDRKKEA